MERRRSLDELPVDRDLYARPAIGLLATPRNADAIAASVLRAQRDGYHVLVASRRGDSEAASFARTLGATLVSTGDPEADSRPPREQLALVARNQGHPGLVYHDDPEARIDFSASEETLLAENRFVVDAEVESPVSPEPTVLAGIPAYNEGTTIEPLVAATRRHADDVIVVDDGSDDDTAEAAEAAGATVIGHETNRGYGAALKTIFEAADSSRAAHLVVLDGDGQHDTGDIDELVAAQRETGADIVVGSRFEGDAETRMPIYRRFGLGVVNVLTNLSLGVLESDNRVRDTQSGFRAYNRRAIESLADDETIGDHMSASLDILYHAHTHGYEIEEVATTIDYGIEEGSSQHPLQHGIALVMSIVRTIERERPITILGVPGVLSTALGVGLGYWAFSLYLRSGGLPTGPALLSSVFTILGILAAFTAIILHSLAVYHE